MTKSSSAPAPTPSDLDESAAMTVADALKIILANSYAIYLKTKNFHWHVSGPYFRDYHLLLDEQAAEILAATDAIAERARKTGNTTLRSIGDIARHQTIKDNDADFVTPQDMLAELRADNLHMVESLRRAKDVADKAKDNATSGLIDTWTDEAERRAVLVRSRSTSLKLDLTGRETRWPRLLSAPSTLRSTAAVSPSTTPAVRGTSCCAFEGMGDLRSEYRLLGPDLKQAEFRVVTMDVRGFGETSARWTDYSARSVGLDAISIVRRLGAGPATITGNSFAAGSAL